MPLRQRHSDGEGLRVGNNWVFVGAAFAVTWAAILGYLVYLRQTTRRARSLFDSATKAGLR